MTKKNEKQAINPVGLKSNSDLDVDQNLRALTKALWITPVIACVSLPAHAQTSNPDGTTTISPTVTTTRTPDGTTTRTPDGTTTISPSGTTTTTTTTTTTASPMCQTAAATVTPAGTTAGCPEGTNIFTSEIVIGNGCAPGGQVNVRWECPMSNPNNPMVTVNPNGTWSLRSPYPGRPGECCELVIDIDGSEFTRIYYRSAPGAP